jgi:hypothetical protein
VNGGAGFPPKKESARADTILPGHFAFQKKGGAKLGEFGPKIGGPKSKLGGICWATRLHRECGTME